MTDEEIKKIAREFAEYSLSEEKKMYDDETYQRLVDESSKGLFDVRYILQWLSKTHCIVEKEVVRLDFADNRDLAIQFSKGCSPMCDKMKEWHQGKCDELISLFGKELFNGKEDNNG